MTEKNEESAGKKFFVTIEGEEYPWPESFVTAAEIRTLAKIPEGTPIILELPDGTEQTLTEGERVELKPGHRYGRSSKYRRG